DVNSFAQGVVFSVDTGAAVIQEALGTYNQSKFAQQAIDYAYAHGLPVMASAADEDAWHHVFPGPYVHAIMVNAIADFGVPNEPNSWLFLNGCTNFSGNLQVSVSATSCSSEATGRSSGIAGLIVSAGRDAVDAHTLGSPLTANEIRQVITRTADDINFDVPGGPAGGAARGGRVHLTRPDRLRRPADGVALHRHRPLRRDAHDAAPGRPRDDHACRHPGPDGRPDRPAPEPAPRRHVGLRPVHVHDPGAGARPAGKPARRG